MTKKQHVAGEAGGHADAAKNLRTRAEEIVQSKEHFDLGELPSAEELAMSLMLHELRVHQAELEMQNEELRHTQGELEISRAKYFDLYNLAPVGYFTISGQGVILEANLMAANLLGMERQALTGQPFTRLIVPEDQDIHYLFRKKLLETGAPQTCEVRMTRPDGALLWARCDSIPIASGKGGTFQIRTIVIDITELKRAQDRAKQFPKMLLEFQEKERTRIAAELHDSLAQNMLVISNEIKLALKALPAGSPVLEKLAASSELALRTMDETLEIAHGLRPSHLDQLGLEKAVDSLARRVAGLLGINIDVEIRLDGNKITPEMEINIFRIIQEGLNNIMKHSKAKNAFIDLGVSNNSLMLTITDDGKGFDAAGDGSSGFGIISMIKRAKILNGMCKIKSCGDGTVISVIIPPPPPKGGNNRPMRLIK